MSVNPPSDFAVVEDEEVEEFAELQVVNEGYAQTGRYQFADSNLKTRAIQSFAAESFTQLSFESSAPTLLTRQLSSQDPNPHSLAPQGDVEDGQQSSDEEKRRPKGMNCCDSEARRGEEVRGHEVRGERERCHSFIRSENVEGTEEEREKEREKEMEYRSTEPRKHGNETPSLFSRRPPFPLSSPPLSLLPPSSLPPRPPHPSPPPPPPPSLALRTPNSLHSHPSLSTLPARPSAYQAEFLSSKLSFLPTVPTPSYSHPPSFTLPSPPPLPIPDLSSVYFAPATPLPSSTPLFPPTSLRSSTPSHPLTPLPTNPLPTSARFVLPNPTSTIHASSSQNSPRLQKSHSALKPADEMQMVDDLANAAQRQRQQLMTMADQVVKMLKQRTDEAERKAANAIVEAEMAQRSFSSERRRAEAAEAGMVAAAKEANESREMLERWQVHARECEDQSSAARSELVSVRNDLTSQLSSLEASLSSAESTISSLQSTLASLQEEHQRCKSDLEERESKIQMLTITVESLQEALNHVTVSKEKERLEKERLKAAAQEIQADLDTKIQHLTDRQRELDSDLCEVSAQLASAREEVVKKSTALEASRSQVRDAAMAAATTAAELTAAAAAQSLLEERCLVAEAAAVEKRKALDLLTLQAARRDKDWEKRVEDVLARLEEQQRLTCDAEDAKRRLKDARDTLDREVSQLRSNRDALKDEYDAVSQRLLSASDEKHRLIAEVSESSSRRREAEAAAAAARAANESTQAAMTQMNRRIQCMTGQEDVLSVQPHDVLESLSGTLEQALPKIRNALLDARVAAARSLEASEAAQCSVCLSAPRDTFLNCGHIICRRCSERVERCPICRTEITSRSRAFV